MGQAVKDRTHVVVVDDHKMIREGVSRIFRDYGFPDVQTAESGEKALEIKAQMPSGDAVAIITDTEMPGMSGILLTKQIRSNDPQAVIIGMSISPVYKQALLAAGADYFLSKEKAFDLPQMTENLLVQRFENN